MTLGFTGTSHGMTQRQRGAVRRLFEELQLIELHHGDCIGADAEAHDIALAHTNVGSTLNSDRSAMRAAGALKGVVVIHPPSDLKHRAFCRDAFLVLPARPYLARNRDIVAAGVDGLVAAPRDYVEPASLRGQGTWTTIGYARRAGRRVWIVYPDGTLKHEDHTTQEAGYGHGV